MCLFNKRKQSSHITTEPKAKLECNHKYREFPWYKYMTYNTDSNSMSLVIYKSYVCIHCRKRKDVELYHTDRVDLSWEEALKVSDEYKERYKGKLMDYALVEEQIADFQLIDREYLKLAQECFPDREILLKHDV